LARRGARHLFHSQFSILKQEEIRVYFHLRMENGKLRMENMD